jgi:TonB family protein
LPPPNKKVETPPLEPPKPVFGVTEESVTEGDSSVAVRVGNTLMKEPEKDLTDPANVKPYAGPDTKVYQIAELDGVPKRLAGDQPAYPAMARRAGRTGLVVLRFTIGRTGAVSSVQVLKESPPGIGFGQAAVDAVSKYRYTAPTVGGIAVSVAVELPIRFTLD